MTRDEALQKIKKCLALAKSQEPHEAAAAMRQAQKLMAEHSITETDITLADVQEARANAKHQLITQWETNLAHMVADAFGVYFQAQYLQRVTRSMNWVKKLQFVFIGVGAAPEVASYAYEVLSKQCANARLAHIRKQPKSCKQKTLTARGDTFARGWVWGVKGLIDSFAAVDRNDRLIGQYLAIHHAGVKTVAVKDRSKGCNAGYHDEQTGFELGKKAQLNRGVGGVAAQGLLS